MAYAKVSVPVSLSDWGWERHLDMPQLVQLAEQFKCDTLQDIRPNGAKIFFEILKRKFPMGKTGTEFEGKKKS